MRLLLINPKFPESFWSFKWAIDHVLPGTRAVNPPLGLATLAALCPPDWQVAIIDENIESVPLAPDVDLIGVCGMGVQFPRQRELLAYYRAKGYRVVAGGSYASLCPEEFTDLADTVVAGEAEYIWPEFCRDVAAGAARALYRETGTVALADSPVPRFDLLTLGAYSNATLQFSRGCPYRCEFCDIIVMFGRRPRVKGLDQVGRELDALRRQGVRSVFFVDDNLIGNRPQAKELLRFLAAYQAEHAYAFCFGTEASLNLAQDAELMALFRAANFAWVFVGIESPDPVNLQETGKTQNLREDTLTAVRRIYANGIDVLGGFIIGFDNDSLDTFARQYRFITDAGIQSAMVGLLTALPHTPLYERVRREGRLNAVAPAADNTRPLTNITPKHMTAAAMGRAYQDLYARLLTPAGIARRIRNKVRHLRAPVYRSGYTVRQRAAIVGRLLTRGILPGGPGHLWHFLCSLPYLAPSRLPLVVSDWIIGLSMRQFALGHLTDHAAEPTALDRRLAALRAAIAGYLHHGRVTLTVRHAGVPDLAMTLDGLLDAAFFRRAARHLGRVLRHTRARLTLYLGDLPVAQARQVEDLLQRLRRYGDRISVVIHQRLAGVVAVDSSVFHLVLAGSGNAAAAP